MYDSEATKATHSVSDAAKEATILSMRSPQLPSRSAVARASFAVSCQGWARPLQGGHPEERKLGTHRRPSGCRVPRPTRRPALDESFAARGCGLVQCTQASDMCGLVPVGLNRAFAAKGQKLRRFSGLGGGAKGGPSVPSLQFDSNFEAGNLRCSSLPSLHSLPCTPFRPCRTLPSLPPALPLF